MESIEDKHNLCRAEGTRMEDAYQAGIKAGAEREACLLANPPQSWDVTTRGWNRTNTTVTGGPETPIRAAP